MQLWSILILQQIGSKRVLDLGHATVVNHALEQISEVFVSDVTFRHDAGERTLGIVRSLRNSFGVCKLDSSRRQGFFVEFSIDVFNAI